ncbi:MAG: amidohydrolase family protein [Blautia sp.]|nr:amidohydrolase family protein [Blautia sp.]
MTDKYHFIADNPNADYYRKCERDYHIGDRPASKVFDSHCHIYPDGIAPKAVIAIDRFYKDLPPSHHDGTASTLLKEGREQGISHFIVHSVATTPAQVTVINHFITRAAAESGGAFTGMGTMHPDSPDPRKDFEELCSLGLKGVKLHPDIQRFDADCPWAMSVYEMCEDAGLPVCVHTGDYRYDYSNPERIAGILKRFPRLTFIGAHFGGWSVWDDAARLLPDYPNLVVDTSSSFYWLEPGNAKELIRAFGSERVMFGTDYPMFPREPELEYLRRLALSSREYEDICWRTCSRVFGIAQSKGEANV